MNVFSIDGVGIAHCAFLLYKAWRDFLSCFRADFSSVLIVPHLNFVSLCSCYKCRIEFAECCYGSFSGKSRQQITEFREALPLEKQCDIRVGCLSHCKQSYAPTQTKLYRFHTFRFLSDALFFWREKPSFFSIAILFQSLLSLCLHCS